MPARGRDLERAPRRGLTAHVGQVDRGRAGRRLGPGAVRLGDALASRQLDHRRQIAHPVHVEARHEGRLVGVLGGHHDRVRSAPARAQRVRQRPRNRSQRPVEAQLPDQHEVVEPTRGPRELRADRGDRDGEVVRCALLAQIRGREVDRDARRRQIVAAVRERAAHAHPALAHRGLRQPDDVERRQAARDVHLDVDGPGLDTEQRRAASTRDHTVTESRRRAVRAGAVVRGKSGSSPGGAWRPPAARHPPRTLGLLPGEQRQHEARAGEHAREEGHDQGRPRGLGRGGRRLHREPHLAGKSQGRLAAASEDGLDHRRSARPARPSGVPGRCRGRRRREPPTRRCRPERRPRRATAPPGGHRGPWAAGTDRSARAPPPPRAAPRPAPARRPRAPARAASRSEAGTARWARGPPRAGRCEGPVRPGARLRPGTRHTEASRLRPPAPTGRWRTRTPGIAAGPRAEGITRASLQ